MKTELLIQLDGLSKKENERVFLLAASNLPWDLDQALLRRLEKRVLVNLPDLNARVNMLNKFIPENRQKDFDYEKMASVLDGYSGSDIRLVCKETLMKGVRRTIALLENDKSNNKNINENVTNKQELVTEKDFYEAVEKTRPASLYKESEYIKWMDDFGSF
jgi:katanin p60 ATPase-containing subunit A1